MTTTTSSSRSAAWATSAEIAGMLPGVPGQAALAGASIDEKLLQHTEAIILSMTPYERENPNVLNSSRKSASPPAPVPRWWTSTGC